MLHIHYPILYPLSKKSILVPSLHGLDQPGIRSYETLKILVTITRSPAVAEKADRTAKRCTLINHHLDDNTLPCS